MEFNNLEFNNLYNDESRSKSPKLVRTADGKVWKYNFNTRTYETIEEKEIKAIHSVVEFIYKGENALKTKSDVISYCSFIKNDICKNCLQLENWNYDFVKMEQLIKFMVKKSIKQEITVESSNILDTIDEASAGGVLIAEKGTHEGKYSCFDINNSYNKFFVDYDLPTNPKYKTVEKINKKTFRLYRLFIAVEYRTKEYNHKFKTTRKWFSYFDIKIFRMFNIPFELVNEENNCIDFDSVLSDFEWMEKLNDFKQKSTGIKKDVLKLFLSSVWGKICCYETQLAFTEDEILPDEYKNKKNIFRGKIDRKYFHKAVDEENNEYINPNQRFKYAVAIAKPFILAYGRLRLLEQIKKLQDKNKKIVYAHTDSVICCDAKEKYFDIGTEIGQFKHETTSEKGIIINNIASKKFL